VRWFVACFSHMALKWFFDELKHAFVRINSHVIVFMMPMRLGVTIIDSGFFGLWFVLII
jgi:hypothetical protein